MIARLRVRLAVAGVVVVAAGLAVHAVGGPGAAADVAGDVLYAVLVALIARFLAPRARPWAPAAVALAFCAAIELLQLTWIPGRAASAFPPAALVLGSGFDARDLAAYLLGVVLGAALAELLRRYPRRGTKERRASP